jgi:putative peptidoglycan lipid II flippase
MAAMQADSPTTSQANSQIARAAGTVMAAFVVSKLIGLLATTLTARVFGTGIDSNSFFAANRFSEILFNLVAGGALASAFIPVFTSLLANEERQKAWKLASSIANLVFIVLVAFSLLTIIFARQVVHYVLAPGFSPDDVILTANLLRVQVISSAIFGLSGLVMGILNSHQHFLLPALAPAMYQLGWIMGIYFLKPSMGIFGLAWGVVIGSLLHLLIQLPKLFRLPQSAYRFSLGLDMPEVREVGRLMAPRLLGVAVVQLNFLVNTFLASYQPEGSIAAINLAFPLMIMPESALAQSIAIAALPTFAAQVAKKQLAEMRSSLSATIRVLLLLSVPATFGLILLRQPIVAFLYQGDQFSADSTALVAWALLWYSVGLVGHSIVEISSRAFYALHDTRTPVLVGVGAMSLNLALSFFFSWLFIRLGWMPHGGLALANSTATLIESVILLVFMSRRLKGLEENKLALSFIKALVASAGMAAAILFLTSSVHLSSQFLNVMLSVVAGMAVYVLILMILKTEELGRIFDIARKGFSLK